MLVLSRRIGQTLNIGNDVTVTVLGIKGDQVRLAFNAPAHIKIWREEIYEKIKLENHENGK